jgi:hypothetical protein
VNHIGATIAVKVWITAAHATGSPSVGGLLARIASHGANPLQCNGILYNLHMALSP